MTATLTDRYVYAVARSLPESRRDDVERELRATIADDVDARVDVGAPAASAERSALEALGDPNRLVAGYLDRPLHLLGPRYYLAWVRLLRRLLAIVLPLAVAASVVAQVIAGTPPAGILGSSIGALITFTVHLFFWSALLFFLLERAEQRPPLRTWSVDSLPTPRVKGALPLSEMISSVVFLTLLAVAIVGQQFLPGFLDGADRTIPILDPATSAWAIPLFLAIIVAEIGFSIWLWKAERWTPAHVAVNAVLAAFSVGVVATIVLGPGLFNPEWFAQFGISGEVDPLVATNVVVVVVSIGVGAWDIMDGAIKAKRSSRSPVEA